MTMAANTRIGEVGINWNGKEYVLRPSFFNLQQIPDIEQAFDTAAKCVAQVSAGITPAPIDIQLCARALDEMAGEPLPEKLTGIITPAVTKGGIKWKSGHMSIAAVCSLAYALLKQGMYGKPSRERIELSKMNMAAAEDKNAPFDVMPFVGLAMAPNGLGKSASDAWNMTMIEFQAAIDMQFPISQKDKQRILPPDDVVKDTAARAAAAASHMKNLGQRRPIKLGAKHGR